MQKVIELLRQQDYGIEIWPSWKDKNDLFTPAERKKIIPLLKGLSVSVHSAGADTLDLHKKQIDAAAEWNAQVVVVHTSDLALKDTSKLDIKLATKVVEYASSCGVKLALENGRLSFLTDAVNKIDDLGICLDVGHVYFTSNSMKDFLATLKDRIIHLHIQDILTNCDYNLGIDFLEHYVPGTGKIPQNDWLLLINTLQQINFEGMAVFEIAPHNPLQTAFLAKTFMQNIIASQNKLS